ncbi:hypothetical protein GHT06_009925 [Daphnia sinensis]|uniref:Uncharacterized protein n=1 Tax=Daphnia sinensis TaxID=1820382 RepID=A0AAD5LR84_9CRUS|nr:hypothetical protein GHT06_009925 [Daphnia sinensis]
MSILNGSEIDGALSDIQWIRQDAPYLFISLIYILSRYYCVYLEFSRACHYLMKISLSEPTLMTWSGPNRSNIVPVRN